MEQRFYVGIKAVFLNRKKEILILKTNPEELYQGTPVHWDLPGGRIKPGADIEGTLRDEVKEELKIEDFSILRLVDVMISRLAPVPDGGISVRTFMVVYLCKLPDDSDIRLSSEHTEYRWVGIREAKELLAAKFPQRFLEKLDDLVTS